MHKLHLININAGSYPKDRPICEKLANFNNCLVDITQHTVLIYDKNGTIRFRCDLKTIEEDFMSTTFMGRYEDGKSFRIVRPGGSFSEGNDLTFGGMSGDEYAVHFSMVDENAPDKVDYETNNDTTFISSAESKAEILVLTADQCKNLQPEMAIDYIKRFLKMITEIGFEFIKFEHIQNIVYGINLAIEFSIIDKNEGYKVLNSLKLSFLSRKQSRYENGNNTMNVNAVRSVEIIPNFQLNEGYLVAVFNHDGGNRNIQMVPKQMKTISRAEKMIKLQGFGVDSHGVAFSDYAISLYFSDYDIEHAELFMLDRNIRIEYR